MYRKICEYCGKEFEVIPSRMEKARFCSRECQGKWQSQNRRGENNPSWKGGNIKKVCEQCGNEFEVKPSLSDQRFCSAECRCKRHSEYMCGKNNPNYMSHETRVKLICKQCGKEFEVIPSRGGKARFCSRDCMGEWYSENLRGESSHGWREGKIIKICEQCKKEFEVYPSQNIIRFCSRECMGSWYSGENATGWRGGISFEPYCPKFNEVFKESIREKFGRVCFLCPTTEEENGKKLSVHHVSYDKDCLCDESDCEFVPLCIRCHAKTNHARDYWENLIMEKLNGTSTVL